MYICHKIESLDFTERIYSTNDSLTYVLVFGFLVLGVVRYLYPRQFSDLLQLPLNAKFILIHGKDQLLKHPFNILFTVFQIIVFSVFIYLFFNQFKDSSQTGSGLLLLIITFYAVFSIAKIMIEKIIANIFSLDTLMNSYLSQKMSYRNIISLLFFIINLIFIYSFSPSHTVLWYAAGLFVLLNMFSLFAIYRRNRNLIGSYFSYFILYLCALEVSPYIILYKLLVDNRI